MRNYNIMNKLNKNVQKKELVEQLGWKNCVPVKSG